MRIGEVAQRTGLSISNIRFYEKKGLIGPERNEQNRYREYEEEDVQQLEKIILYRKMDFTIETIAELLDHKVDVQQAMEPMFTTKPELDRSGMGFSFMEAFLDHLEVVSAPGKGTTVKMEKTIGKGRRLWTTQSL